MRIARLWWVPATLALIVTAGLWYAFATGRPTGPPPPAFLKGTIESVTIALQDDISNVPSLTKSSTDGDKIEALAAVLRRAEPTQDHKCGDVGSIKFRSKDGSETRLSILPGHDPKRYEYRGDTDQGYGVFRVDRAAFLRATDALGIGRDALIPRPPR